MVVASQKVFPEAHISGCYFRFAQALFRKWTEYNLGALYGHEKSQAGNIARMTFRFFLNFLKGLLKVLNNFKLLENRWRGLYEENYLRIF